MGGQDLNLLGKQGASRWENLGKEATDSLKIRNSDKVSM